MPRWGIAAGQQLRHRRWQDEVVVYNDLSGDTHLLSLDAWTLLEQLRAEVAPVGASDLAGHLGWAPDEAAELDAMLDSLCQLALIAPSAD